MTRTVIRIAVCGLVGLTVSGCTIPTLIKPAPEPIEQVVVKPAVVAPVVPVRVAAPVVIEEPVPEAPTNRWAHQRIGATPNLSGGDESSGWGGS